VADFIVWVFILLFGIGGLVLLILGVFAPEGEEDAQLTCFFLGFAAWSAASAGVWYMGAPTKGTVLAGWASIVWAGFAFIALLCSIRLYQQRQKPSTTPGPSDSGGGSRKKKPPVALVHSSRVSENKNQDQPRIH
jgi:hypothetical protein